MTFEDFLGTAGIIDFRLRVVEKAGGFLGGYIHPLGVDGPTIDFFVVENTISFQPPEQKQYEVSTQPSDEETDEEFLDRMNDPMSA